MAPRGAPVPREPSIERTDEYDKFIETLREYHEKRGTVFEAEPKVGPVHIDLLKLYNRVTAEGGYDRVSDTKGNPLAWRRMASGFLPPKTNIAQHAFLLKATYYKNLVAYEITDFHKKEPPPKEILEDVSAKGGDVLNRTLENFQPSNREMEKLGNGNEASDDSGDEQKTPGQDGDKMEVDEPGSVGRGGRSLRQAPPQRVLFGSEITASGRQARSGAHAGQSPTPGGINGYGSGGAMVSIANYEPRQLMPSTVKPVVTPANNSEHFRQIARKMLAQRRSARGIVMPRGMMAPGTGFGGPSIYNRTLLALQSNIPEEIRYALHHLVKISHERGDKYRFDQFTGLAEALVDKVLDISRLFYGFKWIVSYSSTGEPSEPDVLNGMYSTRTLLSKIAAHPLLDVKDGLQSETFVQIMENINEAGLVLRNMVMLDENAMYLSRMPLIRDVVTIVLQLPQRAVVTELRHYALEIVEQLTKFYGLPADDPLYQSLLAQLDSSDRGVIVTTLRAISRISMSLEYRNRMPGVSAHHLRRVCDWLLVEDEELRGACLDFLYQYTTELENVRHLLRAVDIDSVIGMLSRDLMHGARRTENRERSQSAHVARRGADLPPKLSKSIVEQLCAVGDEREQSSQWLLTCFERDDNGEITQLALWTAYNEAFSQMGEPKRPLMQAKDFIQNVSVTFPTAQAQVVPNPDDPKKPRYTIKGIRPRIVPVDPRGRPFIKCLWRTPVMMSTETMGPSLPNGAPKDLKNYEECDMSVARPEEIWDHVLFTHLNISKDPDTGRYNSRTHHNITNGTISSTSHNGSREPPTNPDAMDTDPIPHSSPTPALDIDASYNCYWSNCSHFAEPQTDAALVIRHVQTHLPDTSPMAAKRWQHNRTLETKSTLQQPSAGKTRLFLNTLTDERNDAAGLPLSAALVLRNLARQLRKVDQSNRDALKFGNGGEATNSIVGAVQKSGWVERCFLPHRDRFFYVMAYNLSLQSYLASLLGVIDECLEADAATAAAAAAGSAVEVKV